MKTGLVQALQNPVRRLRTDLFRLCNLINLFNLTRRPVHRLESKRSVPLLELDNFLECFLSSLTALC